MPFPNDEDTRRLIRNHFRRKLEWSEDWFLHVLQTSTKRYDVYWSVIALRDCGTLRSLPLLKKMLTFPMADVKCCSILTIAHIAREAESVFYGETLVSPTYREKCFVMWAINDAADERAVDFVLQYFRDNRAKLHSGQLSGPMNEAVILGFTYLHRIRHKHDKAKEFIAEMKMYWDRLPEKTRNEILREVPDFFGCG